VTAGADGTAGVWDSATRKLVTTLKKHEGAVTTARFSFDSKLLVTTGADGSIVVGDTATWEQTGATMLLPGEIKSAVIGPNKQFVAATSELSNGVRFFEIETGRPFTDGIDLPAEAVSVDLNPDGDVLAIASADDTVKTYGSPFVTEDTPSWMPEFAERIVGLRVNGPRTFAPLYTSYNQLQAIPAGGRSGRFGFRKARQMDDHIRRRSNHVTAHLCHGSHPTSRHGGGTLAGSALRDLRSSTGEPP
jgi:WD40 repeat protein